MRDKKEINIYIGNEIKNARERAGLTQEQFGEMVSLGTKNERKKIRPSAAAAFCAAIPSFV